MRFPAAVLALVALLSASPAAAHDLWIEPVDFSPLVGHPTAVELRVGVGFPGEAVPRREGNIERFALVGPAGPAGAADDRPLTGIEGVSPAGVTRLPAAGDHVLVYRSGETPITLDAEAFEGYLNEEGLEHVSRRRAAAGESDAPGRELFSRSVKALVVGREPAAGAGPPAAGTAAEASPHVRPAGLALELVPATRPAALAPGDELEVRLLWHGEPLAGAKVRGEWHRPGDGAQGSVAAVRTDADGRATLRLPEAGTWKIATVHMVAVPEAEDGDASASVTPTASATVTASADWRSVWTSLTFRLGPRESGPALAAR